MKKDYFLSKREGLSVAMEQLLHYNVWTLVSLDESVYEEDTLLNYFDADFEAPINVEVEKVIAAAVHRTVYEKKYIPENSKKEFARKLALRHVENLRAAKITYHKEVKGMSEREAKTRLKENKMLSRMSYVDNTVKWGTRRAIRKGATYSVGALVAALAPEVVIPGWIIGVVTYGIISILPDKVKIPIRKAVSKGVDTIAKAAKNIADELADRAVAVAKKVQAVIEK